MGSLKIALCAGLVAVSLPVAGGSQICNACVAVPPQAVAPVAVAAPPPPAPCGAKCQVPSRIELRDQFGKVRAFVTFADGEDGKRPITFIDAGGHEIITLAEIPPPPPPTVVSGANPLSGDPLPELVELTEDQVGGKGDGNADIAYLKAQVTELNKQVRLLTARINAAATK